MLQIERELEHKAEAKRLFSQMFLPERMNALEAGKINRECLVAHNTQSDFARPTSPDLST
jgi:hypothetical protein